MSLLSLALASGAFAQDAPPIVNGSSTSSYKQVGALVAIQGNSGGSYCSGTLVAKKWIVTAAHCVEALEEYDAYNYDTYFVVADNVYSSSWDDYDVVVDWWAHPQYNTNTLSNDIGVLKLGSGISSISSMPMNTDSPKNSWVGDDVTFVGYGITSTYANDGGVRRTVDVPLYTADESFIYTYYGSGTVKNICSGDSGGAALMYLGGEYKLVGANSFGFNINGGSPDCEKSGAAAGASRVDVYYDWMVNDIGVPESEESDTDTDSDADTDTDTDADADSDTDTDADTGIAGSDTGNPSRPGLETGKGDGIIGACSNAAPRGASLGLALLALMGLVRRRD